MTPPEPPSSLLERAAQLIESRAAAATTGPWVASGYEMYSTGGDEVVEIGHEAGGFVRQEDATWSATLNPAVAASLAALFRGSADHPAPAALDLAKVILGEPVPGEDG